MKNNVYIIKASGESAEFDAKKLIRSLRRAGAGHEKADAIARAVTREIREGMTTREIYQLAHRMLRKEHHSAAARYSLKQALLTLGPSGFPFEQFIGRLLQADGYRVETGLLRNGHCITHEIDVLARDDNRMLIGECKYHQRQGLISDVKVPLYIHSRFRDLQAGFFSGPDWQDLTLEGWIFTNTRFTDDALQYGRCAGMHLISWDTPFDFGLRDWVDRTGLHPLTCLTTLSQREKDLLLEKNIVLTRDLLADPGALQALRLPPQRLSGVLEEAEQLSTPRTHDQSE